MEIYKNGKNKELLVLVFFMIANSNQSINFLDYLYCDSKLDNSQLSQWELYQNHWRTDKIVLGDGKGAEGYLTEFKTCWLLIQRHGGILSRRDSCASSYIHFNSGLPTHARLF